MALRYFWLIAILVGCADFNTVAVPANFDSNTVTRISFSIEDYEDSQLDEFEEGQFNSVSQEISERFAEAGYPVSNSQEEATGSRTAATDRPSRQIRYTHLLKASVGPTAVTALPKGFTLDFGNSDPRSRSFQKATTVEISCRFMESESKGPPIVLSERKVIPVSLAEHSADTPQRYEKIRRYYVENIGATCHDLLNRLDIYPIEPAQPDRKAPSSEGIRIETEYEQEAAKMDRLPAKPAARSAETSAAPAESTAIPRSSSKPVAGLREPDRSAPDALESDVLESRPAGPAAPDPSPGPRIERDSAVESVPDSSPAAAEAVQNGDEPVDAEAREDAATPSVTTQRNGNGDWRKKKITIFNKGDTVILKFGPDR